MHRYNHTIQYVGLQPDQSLAVTVVLIRLSGTSLSVQPIIVESYFVTYFLTVKLQKHMDVVRPRPAAWLKLWQAKSTYRTLLDGSAEMKAAE